MKKNYSEQRCLRCHALLEGEENRARGYGPDCWAAVQAEEAARARAPQPDLSAVARSRMWQETKPPPPKIQPPWPAWFKEHREHQPAAIKNIADAFTAGVQLCVLDAPTGSGKTLIAEAVRRELNTRALYVCTTRTLQDQVAHDYPYGAVLKGRSNYPTEPEHYDITAADCTKEKDALGDYVCDWCESVPSCPYEIAKNRALDADLAITNTAYWLTEANGPGRFSGFPLVVVDECDTLEKEVMNYVSVRVTQRQLTTLGLSAPKATVEADWSRWCRDAIPAVERVLDKMPRRSDDVRRMRERQRYTRLRDALDRLARGLDEGGWVYTGRGGEVEFKPVEVAALGRDTIWQHSPRFLLMSATADRQLTEDLGWKQEYLYVEMPSSFPVENRPVRVMPVADMGRKGKANGAWERMTDAVAGVVARHRGESVLVHTVSYDLAARLYEGLRAGGHRVVRYGQAGERAGALEEFRDRGGVLLAPSLDRGVDLPDDACRVVVVCKVPYPYLGDRQVSARLYSTRNGKAWYKAQTTRTLIQMTGRHVRHQEDVGVTYILDSAFPHRLWHDAKGMFPGWWRDALVWNWQPNNEER